MHKIYYLIFIFFMVFFIGCNIKDSSRFHGQFYFYENNRPITSSLSSEKFERLKTVFRSTVIEFGFDEDLSMPDTINYLTMRKTKPASNEYISLVGEDAFISVGVSNSNDYVGITIHDHTYNHETEFLTKLKQTIISSLKQQFGFSDIKFQEIGVFILNN